MGNQQWIYGMRPVMESLEDDPGGVVELRISERRRKGIDRLLELASGAGLRVQRAKPEALDELCDGGHHQGVAVRVKPFAYANFDQWLGSLEGDAQALVVVLDEIQDPMNLGAVLRTAAAAGARGVVIPERRASPVTPAAIRASAGVARRLPVCRVVNLARALGQLQKAGFWVSGAVARGGGAPWTVDLGGRAVLVLGSEGKGIRRLVQKGCDHLVTIPLVAGVESLNVSAAAAMLLYEAGRQRALVCEDRVEGDEGA